LITDAAATLCCQGLQIVKRWLQTFCVRFAEAELASQTDEIVEDVFIDNFTECSTSGTTSSATKKGTDYCARYTAYNSARWPRYQPGYRAKLCASCGTCRSTNSTSDRANSADSPSCIALSRDAI